LLPLGLIIAIFVTSCGYRNPYIYSGPDRTVYITSWKNRTSELQLDSKIAQSLHEWYHKSDSLKVVNEKKGADLILGGEIVSIDLPSLSYGANNTTREVKLVLNVKYILKDLATGKILFEVPNETRTEEYTVSSDASVTSENEIKALETIIDELAQSIYLNTLAKLPTK
jgi:hypothetical protein